MKVIFCTQFLGDKPTEPFRRSLENCLPVIEDAGWEHQLVYEQNCPYISAARSKCLRKAYDENPDCIVFLDYDVAWTPESMLKLLETEGDVVAGTYRKKTYNDDYMGVLSIKPDGNLIIRDDGCIKADKIPAGFVKFTIQAINTFAMAYPELMYGLPMKPELDIFNHGVIDRIWYGEDYAFSHRWNAKCGEIWLIPDLDIDHYKGDECFKGNFHKYLLNYNKPKPILSEPLVSVVIPAYNYGRYLGEAIDSVLNQTYRKIEIIVVDDGSTDNTAQVATSYSGVKYIYQNNQGSSVARNTGITAAKGEWILCLDSDDKLKPNYVEKCLSVSEADIISTAIQFFGNDKQIISCNTKPTYYDFVSRNQIHCASMFKKVVWEQVGGFDAALHSVYDDWDFWIGATKLGFEVKSIPQPLFLYRKHGDSMITQALQRHNELYEYMARKHKFGGKQND